jgi:hypothetical protein
MVTLAHEAVEDSMKFRKPFDTLNPGDFAGFFFSQFVSFPCLGQRVGLAEKQDFSLVFFVGIRIKQKDSFLLLDAGEIKKVRIRAQQQDAIGVCGQDVIAVHDCQGVRKQQLPQIASVGREQLAVYRSVSHCHSFNFWLLNRRVSILEQYDNNAIVLKNI